MSKNQDLFPNDYFSSQTRYVANSDAIAFPFSGPFALTTGTLSYGIYGKLVTLVITGAIDTCETEAPFTASNLLPPFLWPTSAQDVLCFGTDNVPIPIQVNIDVSGQIVISSLGAQYPNFTGEDLCGWTRIAVSYLI